MRKPPAERLIKPTRITIQMSDGTKFILGVADAKEVSFSYDSKLKPGPLLGGFPLGMIAHGPAKFQINVDGNYTWTMR